MKMFGKILGWIAKLILVLMLVTLIVPIAYLAWRADQPMELPQFNGLTYYQYLNWRKATLHQMAMEYQAAHPDAKMGGGLDMCFNVDMTGDITFNLPLSGVYVLSDVFPSLQKYIDQSQIKAPSGVTLLNFLPDWWSIFEQFLWIAAEHTPHTSVVYCRLQPNIPSPTEYEAMISVTHP